MAILFFTLNLQVIVTSTITVVVVVGEELLDQIYLTYEDNEIWNS